MRTRTGGIITYKLQIAENPFLNESSNKNENNGESRLVVQILRLFWNILWLQFYQIFM